MRAGFLFREDFFEKNNFIWSSKYIKFKVYKVQIIIYTKNNSSKSLHIQYVTFSLYWETV